MSDWDFDFSDKPVLKGHAIADSMTAARIAQSIFISKFGSKAFDDKPHHIELLTGKDTIWYIYGSHVVSDPEVVSLGAVPTIKIKSKNGEIIDIKYY